MTCDTGMQSARSGDSVLSPAIARTCEAKLSRIEGEHRAQCARSRRCAEAPTVEHSFTERQSWAQWDRRAKVVTSQEIAGKYIEYCLKSGPGKEPGLGKCPNELLNTILDMKFLIVQAWVNEP